MYPIAYTIKFDKKKAGGPDFTVMATGRAMVGRRYGGFYAGKSR